MKRRIRESMKERNDGQWSSVEMECRVRRAAWTEYLREEQETKWKTTEMKERFGRDAEGSSSGK